MRENDRVMLFTYKLDTCLKTSSESTAAQTTYLQIHSEGLFCVCYDVLHTPRGLKPNTAPPQHVME